MLEKAKCEDVTHWLETKIFQTGRTKQLQKVAVQVKKRITVVSVSVLLVISVWMFQRTTQINKIKYDQGSKFIGYLFSL